MQIQKEQFCDCVGKGSWICYLICLFTPVFMILMLMIATVVLAFL